MEIINDDENKTQENQFFRESLNNNTEEGRNKIVNQNIFGTSSSKILLTHTQSIPNKTSYTFENTFMSGVNNARSYGISQFQSSSTLQNSTYSLTMPKDERFRGTYKKSLTDSIYKLPTNKSSRSTNLGYGNRVFLSQVNPNPAPNNYRIKSQFEDNLRKKKGYLIGNKLTYKEGETGKGPGPGQYKTLAASDWFKQSPATLKFRHGFFYDDEIKNNQGVSPQKYKISTKSVRDTRYENIGIGIGYGNRDKIDQGNSFKTPGPGQYNLPSIFDKNRRNKPALN